MMQNSEGAMVSASPQFDVGTPRMSEEEIRIIADILFRHPGMSGTNPEEIATNARTAILTDQATSEMPREKIDQMVTALTRHVEASREYAGARQKNNPWISAVSVGAILVLLLAASALYRRSKNVPLT